MTKKDLKNIIAGAIASGGLVAAGMQGINKPDCDYLVPFEDKEICITEEQKQLIESELPVSQGFGGIKFGN